MLRKFAFGTVLALAAGVTVGCDSGATKPGEKTTGKSNLMANAQKQTQEAQKAAMDKGKEVADKGKEVVEKGKDAVKEGADKVAEALRSETLKPITEKLKAITDKVGGMTGDAGTKAKASLADFTKLVDAFKAAPIDKVKELAGPLTTKFTELLKLVGLS